MLLLRIKVEIKENIVEKSTVQKSVILKEFVTAARSLLPHLVPPTPILQLKKKKHTFSKH